MSPDPRDIDRDPQEVYYSGDDDPFIGERLSDTYDHAPWWRDGER